ncbi:MAG: peptidase caspase catalytic subunit [Actinomycetia bacterium]|nr:peptidase caspase catalytic subunit [Actinomycetes bacterium]
MRTDVLWRALLATTAAGALLTTGAAANAETGGPPRCTTYQVDVTTEFTDAAAGHRYARILLRNEGAACTLTGYSGLQLVAKNGHTLPTDAVHAPASDRPVVEVALQPYERAAADIDWVVNGPCPPPGRDDDGAEAWQPTFVEVYPSDDGGHLVLPWTYGWLCGDGDGGPAPINVSPYYAIR